MQVVVEVYVGIGVFGQLQQGGVEVFVVDGLDDFVVVMVVVLQLCCVVVWMDYVFVYYYGFGYYCVFDVGLVQGVVVMFGEGKID